MTTYPIKVTLGVNNRRHIINLESHKLKIEVLNPRFEPSLDLYNELKPTDIAFSAVFNLFKENRYEVYFRIINPKDRHLNNNPWTFDLFLDLAADYFLSVWHIEHNNFRINPVHEANMEPYKFNQRISFGK